MPRNESSPSPNSFVRKHAVALIASAAITAGVIYTVRSGGLKLVPDAGDFTGVHWWALAAYVPLWLGMTWYRAVRWRFLLRAIAPDVPKRRLFSVSLVGFAGVLLLPFRLGELARPYMLRKAHPTASMTAATSSVIAERVLDGVFLSVLLAIVLLAVPALDPLPERVADLPISVAAVRATGFVMLGIFTSALAVIAVFYFARAFALRATRAVFGKLSPALGEKLAGFAEKLADGLHVLGSAPDALGFLVETTLYWGCNIVGMWILALGCGIAHADGSLITLPETCGLIGLLGCAMLIPGPPGLLGLFQAGIYAGLAMYFPKAMVIGPGAAYVFLLYMSQLTLQIAGGVWGLWLERRVPVEAL